MLTFKLNSLVNNENTIKVNIWLLKSAIINEKVSFHMLYTSNTPNRSIQSVMSILYCTRSPIESSLLTEDNLENICNIFREVRYRQTISKRN